MPISKEEYQKILEEIYNEQYNDEPETDLIPDDSWIPAESSAKEAMLRATNNKHGIIDVTKFRKEKIQDALYKCMNIQVGGFLIRIDSYNGEPGKLSKGATLSLDIEVWEKRFKTPSGNPCNMDFRMDWSKDNRFFGRPWLKHFGNGNSSSAHDVPVETVIEIVRWMQALKRMNAFL